MLCMRNRKLHGGPSPKRVNEISMNSGIWACREAASGCNPFRQACSNARPHLHFGVVWAETSAQLRVDRRTAVNPNFGRTHADSH